MIETITTRHNPLVDPSLHLWEWQIPVYLFLGGLVAGLMILSGYHIVRDQYDKDRPHGHYVTAPLLSLALLSLGMFALFLDLEHKIDVWRLYLTFQPTSPMSWGSWILLLVYPVLLLTALLTLSSSMPWLARRVPALGSLSEGLRARSRLVNFAGFANVALGVMLGIYTGILLSALGARPLWNSALLGPLFLFSGLSTGAAAMHMLSHIRKQDDEFGDTLMQALAQWLRPKEESHVGSNKLIQADNSFLTVELTILCLFLIGLMSSSEVHQQAAKLLLTGPYSSVFWVFVIGTGILIPLILQFLQTQNRIRPTMVPAVLVLCGGLILRFVLVYAGQASHWSHIAGL